MRRPGGCVAGPRRGAVPPGGGQLRERLLRRDPRDRLTPRVGPVRLVGQDLANPTDVRLAAIVLRFPRGALGVRPRRAERGVGDAADRGVCVVAAWYYTGGGGRTATAGSARCSSSSSSGWSRRWGRSTRRRALTVVGVLGGRGGGAGLGGPRRQQPARHPVRRGGREADPGGSARGPRHAGVYAACRRSRCWPWWACAALGSWFALLALPAYALLWPALTPCARVPRAATSSPCWPAPASSSSCGPSSSALGLALSRAFA